MLINAKVLSIVLVPIRQVVTLNWSYTIYTNLGLPRQKRRKSTCFIQKWSQSILDSSDVPETYVGNSWGPKQRYGINQPRSTEVTPYTLTKGTLAKNAENRYF